MRDTVVKLSEKCCSSLDHSDHSMFKSTTFTSNVTQIVDLLDIPEGGGAIAMTSCSPGGQKGCVSLFLSIP